MCTGSVWCWATRVVPRRAGRCRGCDGVTVTAITRDGGGGAAVGGGDAGGIVS